jgi:hypothetical protein
LDQKTLLELLYYDEGTGKLFWRPRERKHFNSDASCKRFNKRFGDKEAFTANSRGYLVGRIFKKGYFSHRVIWMMVYGEWPDPFGHLDYCWSDEAARELVDEEMQNWDLAEGNT